MTLTKNNHEALTKKDNLLLLVKSKKHIKANIAARLATEQADKLLQELCIPSTDRT